MPMPMLRLNDSNAQLANVSSTQWHALRNSLAVPGRWVPRLSIDHVEWSREGTAQAVWVCVCVSDLSLRHCIAFFFAICIAASWFLWTCCAFSEKTKRRDVAVSLRHKTQRQKQRRDLRLHPTPHFTPSPVPMAIAYFMAHGSSFSSKTDDSIIASLPLSVSPGRTENNDQILHFTTTTLTL